MQEVYTYEQVYESTLTYFKNDDIATKVWIGKYALKNNKGEFLERTPIDMHWRLAKELARIEAQYPNPLKEETIFNLLTQFKYLVPQGGPMAGIGNDYQVMSLSNCFVVGNDHDSYGGIMILDQEIVQLEKRRAGVGVDISHLRPKGASVQNAAMTSSGATSFAERFSNSTREVAQGGRRGALMISMDIRHPDAEDFIDMKMEQGKVTGANVSIKIRNDFMEAVEKGTPYFQYYPINKEGNKSVRSTDAKRLWEKIINNAWTSAEPGILFWDKIIEESPADSYSEEGFTTISTNPCGEIPLCPYDSCRLLAINLYGYVKNPFTPSAYFDFVLFKTHVEIAQRLMDDIVDLEIEQINKIIAKVKNDPEPPYVKRTELELWGKILEKAKQGRRTGLGVTAEGDMLAALGIKYGSPKGNDFCEKLHETLAIYSYKSSIQLAKERGCFPIWNKAKEHNNPFVHRILENIDIDSFEKYQNFGRRNISNLTIAPTGTVSLLTQTTSGIEPLFLISYERRKKINPSDIASKANFIDEQGDKWEVYNVFHDKFVKWYEINHKLDIKENENILEKLQSLHPTVFSLLVKDSPYFESTSDDIDWVSKIELQGRVQKWVDHSISVTVNIPKNISKKKVEEIYMTAWKAGCKGCTIYREGSRDGVLLRKEEVQIEHGDNHAVERPKVLDAQMVFFQNNKEKWVAFIGVLDNRPYEIFTGKVDERIALIPKSPNAIGGKIIKEVVGGHSRYDFHGVDYSNRPIILEGISNCFDPEYWNYAKLISGVLRHRMPISSLIKLINDLNFKEESINTWKVGVIRGLKQFIPNGTESKEQCPECGQSTLKYEEGCLVCKNCGYGKCG